MTYQVTETKAPFICFDLTDGRAVRIAVRHIVRYQPGDDTRTVVYTVDGQVFSIDAPAHEIDKRIRDVGWE